MKEGKFLKAVIFLLLAAIVLINAHDIYRHKQQINALYKLIEWQDEVIEEHSEILRSME